MPTQPMTYREISDLWGDVSQLPNFKSRFKDMGQFSQWYNQQTGSDVMSAGLHPNILKSASVGLDKMLEATGLPKVTGKAGQAAFEALGLKPEAGYQFGEGFPRGAAELTAVLGGLTAGGPVGWAAAGLGAAASGAKTYTETDSPVAGLITAGSQLAFPQSMVLGRQALAPVGRKLLGEEVAGNLVSRFPGKGGQALEKAFDWLGESVGAVGNMEAANVGTALVMGQAPDWSAEHWAGQALAMLPAVPFQIRDVIRGPKAGPTGRLPRSFVEQDFIAQNAIREKARLRAEVDTQQANAVKTTADSEGILYSRMDQGEGIDIPFEGWKPGGQDWIEYGAWEREGGVPAEDSVMGTLVPSSDRTPTTITSQKGTPMFKVGDKVRIQSGGEGTIESLDESIYVPRYVVAEGEGANLRRTKFPQYMLEAIVTAEKVVETAADGTLPVSPEKLGATMVAHNEMADAVGAPKTSDARVIDHLTENKEQGASTKEAAIKTARAIQNEAVKLANEVLEAPLPGSSEFVGPLPSQEFLARQQHQQIWDQLRAAEKEQYAKAEEERKRLGTKRMEKSLEESGRKERVQKATASVEKAFATLPEEQQSLLGEVFTQMSKQHETDLDIDMSIEWGTRALEWLHLPSKDWLVKTNRDAAKLELMKLLGRTANTILKHRQDPRYVQNRLSRQGVAEGLVVTDSFGENAEHPGLVKLSLAGHEVVQDMVRENKKTLANDPTRLLEPLTLEEVKKFKPTATSIDVNRFRAFILSVVDGQIKWERILTKDKKTGAQEAKWQFQYSDWAMQDLRAVFGDVKDATITTWARKNLGLLQQIMTERINLGKVEGAGDTIKGNLFGIVTQRATPGVPFGAASEWWFRQWWTNKGYSAGEAEMLSRVAQRVGSLFPEVDKLTLAEITTGAISQNLSGFYSQAAQLIGLNPRTESQGNRAFNSFYKLMILGHEITHGMQNAYVDGLMSPERAQIFRNAMTYAEDLTQTQRVFILKDLFDTMVPKEIMKESEGQVENIVNHMAAYSASPAEFLSTYGGLAMLGVASPNGFRTSSLTKLQEYVRFSPEHLASFVNHQYLDIANLGLALQDYHNFQSASDLPVGYEQLTTAFSKLARTEQELESVRQKILNLNNNLEGGLASYVGKIAVFDPHGTGIEAAPFFGSDKATNEAMSGFQETIKNFGLSPNWYERTFLPAAQYAERFPFVKDVIDLAYNFRGLAGRFANQMLAPFMGTDKHGKLVLDPNHTGLTKVMSTPELRDTFNGICLEMNARMKDKDWDGNMLTDKEVQSLGKAHGLSPGDIDIVLNTFNSTMKAMEGARSVLIQAKVLQAGLPAAHMFMGENGLNGPAALKLAVNLSASMWEKMQATARLATDPVGAAQLIARAEEQLASVAKTVPKELFDKAVEETAKLHKTALELKSQLDSQPYFTPEVRIGRYFIRYRRLGDNQPYLMAYHTQEQLFAARRKAEADQSVIAASIRTWDKMDRQQDVNLLHSNQARAFTAVETAAYEASRKAALDKNPGMEAVFNSLGYKPGEAVYKEMVARGMGKHRLKRSLTPGREEINFMEGVIDYITGLSMGLAKTYTKDTTMLFLSDKAMEANPRVRNTMRDYLSQVIDPPTREWSTLKNMVFTMTLGMNPSSVIVERMQPIFSLVPYLTEHGAGLVGSYKYVARAAKTLWNTRFEDGKLLGLDPEFAAALKKATDEQVIDFGVYQELAHDTDLGIVNLRNLVTQQDSITSKATLLAKPILGYANIARNLYTHQTSHNSRLAFLSNYLLAKDQKMSPEDAYKFAVQGTRATMFGGGAAARPIGLFSNMGKFYGAGGAWYTLQQYTMSSIGMMYRLAMDGFTRQHRAGMTTSEINNAKKAFTQMFVTQFAAAGAMGLPLVGFGMSGLEQLFPGLNLKQTVRETLAKLGGDDDETGQVIGDSILNGFVTKALGLGAVDLSTRFSLGQILGLDPQEGFMAERMFGPTVGVLGNFLRGTAQSISGQPGQGLNLMLPTAWKNLHKMIRDGGEVRDQRGRLLYTPTDFERTVYALGFKPKAISNIREEQRLSRRASDIASRDLRDFHDEVATNMLNGNFQTVRELLMARHKEDPSYDPVSGLRQVSQLAQDRVTPMDVTERGSRGSLVDREELKRMFPQYANPPSEVDLYLRRKELERQVGFPGAGIPTGTELSEATMVDQLLKTSPALTRSHAQALVRQLLGRRFATRPYPLRPSYTLPEQMSFGGE